MAPPPTSTGRGGKGGASFDPNNVSMLSIPKQTKLFVERLRDISSRGGDKILEYQIMVEIGKSMNLQVGDFRNFIDKLNS